MGENKKILLSGMIGVVIGMLGLVLLSIYLDQIPDSYINAMKPALSASGIVGNTPCALRRALNPCIVKEQLPAGCEKYVKNGVVTQPPIKIIVDKANRSQRKGLYA